ncbi:MAG: S8 family serine peptidase [Chloroflexota bacterium]
MIKLTWIVSGLTVLALLTSAGGATARTPLSEMPPAASSHPLDAPPPPAAGTPVDPALSALQVEKLDVESSSAAQQSLAQAVNYEHQYEWTGSQAISDNNCSDGTHQFINLGVTEIFDVRELHVGINISHFWRSDLRAWLHSPAGSSVQLLNGLEGGSDDNLDVLFQDGGSTYYLGSHNIGMPYYENSWAPQAGTLASFNGEPAQGNWQLEICDDSAGSTGKLFQWALFFNPPLIPDLSKSYKSAPLSARPGELITYTITISNSGTAPASQAWMRDPIPVGTSFAYTVTPGLDYNAALNQVEWDGNLSQGEQIALTFAVQAAVASECGNQILNQALISDTLNTKPVNLQARSEIWENVHLSADFEADAGGFSPSGSPSSWAWGNLTTYQGSGIDFPTSAHSGIKAWATNPGNDYGNDEDAYLTSAAIDLSRAPSMEGYPLWLTWWQWLRSEANYDFASMEVRGGAYNWTRIYGPVSGAVDMAWTQHAVNVSQFAGVSDFQVRFHFTSDVSIVFAGWYIDDVLLVQCQPPSGLHLTPDALEISGCNGIVQEHNLVLTNLTGAAGTFNLSYELDPAMGSLSGPAALFLEDGSSANFQVMLEPQVCVPDGLSLPASVSVEGNGFSDTTSITKTISAAGSWELKAQIPSGGLYDLAVIDGGDGGLYALGGSGASTRLNLRYDLASDSWSSRTILPADLRILDGVQIGGTSSAGNIYLPGGYSGSSIVTSHLVYHPSSDTWSSAAAAPRSVAGYGAAACDERLYRVGGALQATWPNGEMGAEVYDPGSDSWVALAPMPSGHTFPAVACMDGKLYVAGGINQAGSASSAAEVYDIASNTWSDLDMADLPETRWGAADFILDGRLYLAGGILNGSATKSVAVYDFTRNVWEAGTPLSEARFRLEGDSGYVVGGMEPAWQAHTTNEKLTLCPSCSQRGWLEGWVHDFDSINPPTMPASISIDPGNLQISVQASGYYSASLVPWEYQTSASAEGYPTPVGPWPVTVANGIASQLDFTLPRPDIQVEPQSLRATILAPGQASMDFNIDNNGTWPLAFEIRELRPAQSQALPPDETTTKAIPAPIEIEPALLEQIDANKAAGGTTPGYLIYLRQRSDLSPALKMNWQSRGRWVVETLQKNAAATQAGLRAYLDSQQVDYKAYWIDNVIVVNASSLAAFNGLLAYDEISALRARRHPIFYEPESTRDYAEALQAMLVQSNLTHVGAGQVWAQGTLGQGIVIANIDTGVNYTHEALVQSYRGNLGNNIFDHNHNWYDPPGGTQLTEPADWNNHGSHTMGTMLGSTNPADPLAASNTIGMAPGAKWIACRAFEQSDQELLECGQFMAAPTEVDGVTDPAPDLRPHIINNSWGDCTRTYDPWYDGVLDSWHALGIYPVFSNGNASNCGYFYPPGLNTVGSPARAGNVTGVGATGRDNGQYATYSNWGPSDQSDIYNPLGYPRLKPQVVAPGTNTSAGRTGNAYLDMTGTSMAAPHVAGLIALMWSAAPCLVGDYVETETILQQSANPLPYPSGGEPPPGPGNVPNYATGWGEINAPAAVQAGIDFCTTDWLPWVTLTPISGTISGGLSSVIQVDFTCSPEAAEQPQPLQGKVRVKHNDPSQAAIDVDLQLYCVGEDPIPVWDKQVWINGQLAESVNGPHTVRPGDLVTILDQVGAASAQPFTATLTETWGAALSLLSYDTAGLGSVETSGGQLTWEIDAVPPGLSYSITKTFQVQYGDWLQDTLTETYQVQSEAMPLPSVVVSLERYLPAIQLEKSGPEVVEDGDLAMITLTVRSEGNFYGDLALTDPLPTGMTVLGEVNASFGTAWIESGTGSSGGTSSGNEIHWSASTSPPGTALPAIVTIHFVARFRGSPGDRFENIAYLDWAVGQVPADYTSDQLITYIAGTADLAVTLSATPSPIYTGESLTYALSVENKGPDAVYNAILADTLPPGASFVSASPGCSHNGNVVTCELDRLLRGEKREITILVIAPAAPGLIANQASITAAGHDPYAKNNWTLLLTQVYLRLLIPLLFR